jgi:hypothetical protein
LAVDALARCEPGRVHRRPYLAVLVFLAVHTALCAQTNLARSNFSLEILGLARVLLNGNRLVANVFHFMDAMGREAGEQNGDDGVAAGRDPGVR